MSIDLVLFSKID